MGQHRLGNKRMIKYHDLAIRWNDRNASIERLMQTGSIAIHGLPRYFEVGKWVAIVSQGNFIQLMFKASAIEGPKKVKLANGDTKEKGYIIKADRRTIRRPKAIQSPINRWRAIGQFRYFDVNKMKAVQIESFDLSRNNDRGYIETVSGTEFEVHKNGIPGLPHNNPEAKLVDKYVKWMEGNTRFGHNFIQDAHLFVDLFDLTHWQLIEAKVATNRETIRMAIGQLRDYKRYYNRPPSLAVLLASRPSPDCMYLLTDNRISMIWKNPSGSFSTKRWQS